VTLPSVVFLVDVDNMLLDNDRVAADLRRHLERQPGRERQERYRAIFEQLRSQLGYADYLGAIQRYRVEFPREPHVLTVSSFLVNYPFASRLYPNSLDVLERFGANGDFFRWRRRISAAQGGALGASGSGGFQRPHLYP